MKLEYKGKIVTFCSTLFFLMMCLLELGVTQEVKGKDSNRSESAKASPSLQSEAVELLKKVSTTYRNLKQFQYEVDFKSHVNSSLGQKNRETHISVAAIRPEKMKVILRNTAGQVQYFRNGTTNNSSASP